MKVQGKVYLTSSKEDMVLRFDEMCEDNGVVPTEDARDNSSYACYEVEIDVIWDTETGDCKVIGVKDS